MKHIIKIVGEYDRDGYRSLLSDETRKKVEQKEFEAEQARRLLIPKIQLTELKEGRS